MNEQEVNPNIGGFEEGGDLLRLALCSTGLDGNDTDQIPSNGSFSSLKL